MLHCNLLHCVCLEKGREFPFHQFNIYDVVGTSLGTTVHTETADRNSPSAEEVKYKLLKLSGPRAECRGMSKTL